MVFPTFWSTPSLKWIKPIQANQQLLDGITLVNKLPRHKTINLPLFDINLPNFINKSNNARGQ
ncbi:unnamed protein product, partial [Sphagnum jensenii]